MALEEQLGLETGFLNLEPEEYEKTIQWYDHLKTVEQNRIIKALDLLNKKEFYLNSNKRNEQTKCAIITAGSSIDKKDYSDIDLFVLTKKTLKVDNADDRLDYPRSEFYINMGNLPNGIYTDTDYENKTKEKYSQNDLKIDGAKVTISLVYELKKFDKRRQGSSDDFLEINGMGAEKMMQYNKEQGSKFILLCRQYKT